MHTMRDQQRLYDIRAPLPWLTWLRMGWVGHIYFWRLVHYLATCHIEQRLECIMWSSKFPSSKEVEVVIYADSLI